MHVSQEVDKVVWHSYLLKNFPQFVVICTVKGFSIVNEAEVDDFMEFSCFFYDPTDVGNLISGSSAFFKSSLNKIGKGVCQGSIVSPCLFNFYAEYIMQNAGLDEA